MHVSQGWICTVNGGCWLPSRAVTQPRWKPGDSSQSPRQPSSVYFILIFMAIQPMDETQAAVGARQAGLQGQWWHARWQGMVGRDGPQDRVPPVPVPESQRLVGT